MSKNIKSYLKGLGSGYGKTALVILVGLWMVPFTLQYLTLAEFGVFAIAGDILIWLGLLQLGTGGVLNSRAAQLIGKGDVASLSELTSTAFILQLIVAALMIVVGGGISLTVDHWFQTNTSVDGLSLVVFVLVLGMSIRITGQVFNALLVANKQIHLSNYLGIGQFLLRTGLTVAFLVMGLKLMALAWSTLISTVTVSLFTYWWMRRELPDVKISMKKFRIEHVKDLLGKGVWFTIGGLAGILIVSMDRFMVGRYVSLEVVAAFVITGKLFFVAEKVHGQIFNVMRPYLAQLHGQGRMKRLQELYHVSFSGALLLSVLMASVILILNKGFIGWWVGPEFYLGDTVCFLFAMNFVLQSSVLPNRALLASTLYKPRAHSIIRIIEGGVNLIGTYVLVMYFEESGVLLGSVIATLLLSSIALNILVRSYFRSQKLKGSPLTYVAYLAVLSLFLVFWNCAKSYYMFPVAMLWFLLVSGFVVYGNRETLVIKKIYDRVFSRS